MNGVRRVQDTGKDLIPDLLREKTVIMPYDDGLLMHQVLEGLPGIVRHPVIAVTVVDKDNVESPVQ